MSPSVLQLQKDEIVSFMDTDLDAVVAMILKFPARFQLALQERDATPRTVQSDTFGDGQESCNVIIRERDEHEEVSKGGRR
jgi:hypothetical protein